MPSKVGKDVICKKRVQPGLALGLVQQSLALIASRAFYGHPHIHFVSTFDNVMVGEIASFIS